MTFHSQLRPIFLKTFVIIYLMKHQSHYLRIVRLSFGISLLVYLLSREKLPNWLPFYTFQTNLLVGVWFLFAGISPGENGKPTFWMKDSIKGAVTTYITITGLVYNLVLIPYEVAWLGHISSTSIVTHMVVPTIMILDYCLSPVLEKPSWRNLYIVTGYPLLYAAGTIIRWFFIRTWPYPFIDPAQVGSMPKLIFNYFTLFAVHVGMAAVYVSLARWKFRRTGNPEQEK